MGTDLHLGLAEGGSPPLCKHNAQYSADKSVS